MMKTELNTLRWSGEISEASFLHQRSAKVFLPQNFITAERTEKRRLREVSFDWTSWITGSGGFFKVTKSICFALSNEKVPKARTVTARNAMPGLQDKIMI